MTTRSGSVYATQREPNRKGGKRRTISTQSSSRPCEPTIFTIGHGTRSIQDLVNILQSAGIRKLIDVRSFPRSRANPQFNREGLVICEELAAAHIEYIWLGPNLGGRRNSNQPGIARHTAIRVDSFRNYAGYMSTSPFKEGLESLKDLARQANVDNGSVAIVCSESVWWRCHRRMISDVLVSQGWRVRHLGVSSESTGHTLWDIARSEDGELVYNNEKNTK